MRKRKFPEIARLNYTFLPIASLEKYLHQYLIDDVDAQFFREVNDRFFRKKSLDEVVAEYISSGVDKKGKKLWNKMVSCLGDDGLSEQEFLREICSAIYQRLDTTALTTRIVALF